MEKKLVWLVCEVSKDIFNSNSAVVGVFDDEELAVKACYNDMCYVAELGLNEEAPREWVPFPKLYFPMRGETSGKNNN